MLWMSKHRNAPFSPKEHFRIFRFVSAEPEKVPTAKVILPVQPPDNLHLGCDSGCRGKLSIAGEEGIETRHRKFDGLRLLLGRTDIAARP